MPRCVEDVADDGPSDSRISYPPGSAGLPSCIRWLATFVDKDKVFGTDPKQRCRSRKCAKSCCEVMAFHPGEGSSSLVHNAPVSYSTRLILIDGGQEGAGPMRASAHARALGNMGRSADVNCKTVPSVPPSAMHFAIIVYSQSVSGPETIGLISRYYSSHKCTFRPFISAPMARRPLLLALLLAAIAVQLMCDGLRLHVTLTRRLTRRALAMPRFPRASP